MLVGFLFLAVGATVYIAINFRTFSSSAARSKDIAGSSISLVEAGAKLGDTIHFTYTLPKGVKDAPNGSGTQARIQVMCYQGDSLVYGEALNAFDAKTSGLLLGGAGSLWLYDSTYIHNSSDCVATLYQWDYSGGSQKFVSFTTTSFTASGK